MKILLTIFLSLCLSFSVPGQCQMLNPGFENTSTITLPNSSAVHPTNWDPLLSLVISAFSGVPLGVDSSHDAQSGQLALELFKDSSLNPQMVGGDVLSQQACGSFVSAVSGHYKLSGVGQGDSVIMLAFVSRFDQSTQTTDTIGIGAMAFTSNQSSYAPFALSVSYPSLANSPDSIGIYIQYFPNSSQQTSFLIDDINLSTFVVGVEDQKQNSDHLQIYPNPSSRLLNVDFGNEVIDQLRILSSDGRLVFEKQINQTTTQIDLSIFDSGLYFLQLRSESSEWIQRKFTKL